MRRHDVGEVVGIGLLAGKGWGKIAAELGMSEAALRQDERRENKRRGVNRYQRLLFTCLTRIGLWHGEGEPTGWNDPDDPQLKDDIMWETDTVRDGRAICYVLTPPPEKRVLYRNIMTHKFYGTSPDDRRTETVWESRSYPGRYPRVNIVESTEKEYHSQSVRMAKAILEIGDWLGRGEADRVKRLIGQYQAFVLARYPDVWESTKPDILSIGGVYTKQYLCSDPNHTHGDKVLEFTARLSYWPEWRLYQAIYDPSNEPAEEEIRLLTSFTAV